MNSGSLQNIRPGLQDTSPSPRLKISCGLPSHFLPLDSSGGRRPDGVAGPWSPSPRERERTVYCCDILPQAGCKRVASPVQRRGVSCGCRFQKPTWKIVQDMDPEVKNSGDPYVSSSPWATHALPLWVCVGAMDVKMMYLDKDFLSSSSLGV